MKHGPVVGWMIYGSYGPLKLTRGWRGTRGPILAHGGMATLFPTRKAAELALRATNVYAKRMGFTNKAWTEHRITRCCRAPDA